jgi:hypothetical protein
MLIGRRYVLFTGCIYGYRMDIWCFMEIKKFIRKNQLNILFLISIIIILLVLLIVYAVLKQPLKTIDSLSVERGINTLPKLWLKGHLGIFFNFLELGNVQWLSIPIFFIYLFKKKKFSPWEMGLIVVVLFSAILVGYKGCDNARYALTLLPFLCGLTLIMLAELTAGFSWQRQVVVLLIIVSLIGINIFKNNLIQQGWILNNGNYYTQLPWKLFKYGNNLPADTHFMIFNYPEFYYYTNRYGLTYINCIGLITDKGIIPLFEPGNHLTDKQKMNILNNTLHIEYIISPNKSDFERRKYQKFLDNYCSLILTDRDVVLYKIR